VTKEKKPGTGATNKRRKELAAAKYERQAARRAERAARKRRNERIGWTIAALFAVGLVVAVLFWPDSQPADVANPDTTASASPSPSGSPAPQETPEPSCPAGSPKDTTYECLDVTVTGAKGKEPTIELGKDFAPATELGIADVYPGKGDPVAAGATLKVQYVGVGQASRKIFDSSWERGEPATFSLTGVIQGWQQGLLGMQPGGRRLLVIPGSLAYGEAGNPPDIAADETLVFVVDLLEQTPAG
jgi:peptidylprolyl isomerase